MSEGIEVLPEKQATGVFVQRGVSCRG